MPIFEANGKKYNVKDEYLDAFAKDYPDAVTYEDREGKRYRVKSKDYNSFISQFDKPSEPVVATPIEDNSEFEENQRLFAEGKPTKGVTTQSIIGAHPELGLQPKQYSEEVLQRSRENVPDYFKSKKDVPLVDRPLGTDAPIGSDERLAARVDIAKKNLSDPIVQKGRTEAEVRGLSTDIDNNIKDIEGRIKAQRNMNWRPGMPTSHNDGVNRLFGERARLSSAQRLLEESQEVINAAHRGDSGFLNEAWKGFKDGLDAEDFTFGLADAATSASILNALKKVENGESVSDVEDKLLKAAAINMATQYYFANDLSRGYKAGQTTAESIPFMLEMAINPISSFGSASAKTLLNYGLKSFAKQVGKGLLKGAAAGAGMAATTGFGRVTSGAMDKLAGNYNYGVDVNGKLYAEKKEDTMGVGEAVARSFASTAIENQSEMIFRAFDGAGALLKGVDKYIPGGVNTFFDSVKNSKVGQLWRGIKNSPIRKEFMEATKVGGIAEEYLEEVYNNFANVALGEMTMEKALDLDNNIDTFLGLAPTQAMFAMLGLGGMAATRYQTRRDIEDLRAVMNERQREALDGLLKMGSTAEIKDVRAFIRNTMADQTLTIAEKRNAIEAAYDVAKQKAVNDIAEAEIEDKVTEENADIDSKTDTSTGMYAEAVALVSDGEGGLVEQPGNIVGYIGGQPIFVPEGMENTEENRIILKPGDLVEGSIAQAPSEEVKASNEEMIRDEAEAQAELESRYAPEVLNAQMVQGQPIDTPSEQIIPISPMPEGNGWIVEVYAKDTNNKVAAKPEVREMTTDEFRDILQAQLDAEEATIKAEQAVVEEQQQVAPQAEEIVAEQPTIATEEAAQPVMEEANPQAPVIPTKQDGSIDFVAYGKEGSIKELGNQYGEKMPHKVAVTAKAFADDVVKAKENLDKANEALDNAPIGREQKAKEAQINAQQAYEAVKNEADFWAEMDADIKAAQAEREAMLNPQVEVDMSEQPMTVDEFVAQQLANGNITLTSESFKKETGYGEKERKKFPKMFRKAENGGMSIERAGERLMEIAAEEGLAFFDQEDANAGRDALINFLGSVYSWGDITGYVRNNREAMAKKESEDVRDEMESFIWNAYHMTPEEYATQREIEAVENPYENVDLAAIDAIFAEKEFESQTLNQETNESGRIAEGNQGESGILSEEQVGDNGGNQPSEEERNAEGTGNGTQDESETAQEPELTQEEGESVLDFAARVAEEQRRKPLRKRAREWSEALGVDVTIYESVDDIEDEAVKQSVNAIHRNKKLAPGWVTDGKVYFLMSDMIDMDEVDNTYIHEVVAHVGIEKLLGKERFAKLCDKVWEMMPQAAKDYFYNYPEVSNIKDETKRRRKAADEYIAHLAEKQNLTPEEKTIWDNIVKAFRELLDKALNGIIGKAKLTDKDIAELIRASYANLKSGAESKDVVYQNEKTGQTLFSIRTYRESGRDKLIDFVGKRVQDNALTEEQGAEIVSEMDNIYETVQKYTGVYQPFGTWSEADVAVDESGKPVFSVIKANGEYGMNLDFSLVCKKRRTLDAVFDEMIRRGVISDYELGQVDIAKINAVIREFGFETACRLCFVDAKRFRVAKVADDFCAMYNELASMSDAKLKKIVKNTKKATVRKKTAQHLLEHPEDKVMLSRDNFMSAKGFEGIKINKDAVMRLYNSAKGTGGPKASYGDVQYLNDIAAKQWTPEQAYPVGGVRLQSFSDYVPRMVFDYVQMVADLAAKNLPVHAYTKEPIFAKQFGLTGIKINLSLVPRVDADGVAPGLDKDGNYAWQDGETFPYEEAIAIQNVEGYRENCGTIAVGVSDEHIEKMLGDDNIRMVIPYHKSGLNPAVAKFNNIDKFADYTNEQNTRNSEGKKLNKTQLADMPNFNQQMHDGMTAREAAQAYLDWCDANGYLPKFDKFRNHPNYYKLLEDFTTIVPVEGVENVYPQQGVQMRFPSESDAFGSMDNLIREGLEEDAILEGRRQEKIGDVVDAIEDALTDAGLPVEEYESGNNEARMAAVDKVSSQIGGIRFRISNQNQEIFVSNAQKAVEGIKQEKATPQQWLAMIEKNSGLKAGEDKWLGLSDWLKASEKKSITKAEILDFIGENKIRIEEVKYEEGDNVGFDEFGGSSYLDGIEREFDNLRVEYGVADAERKLMENHPGIEEFAYVENGYLEWDYDEAEIAEWINKDARVKSKVNPINSTRLEYTTKGLENKAEIALTVPTIESWNENDEVHFGDAGEGRAIAWIRFGETRGAVNETESVDKYLSEMRSKYNAEEGEETDFMSEDEIKHLQSLTSSEFEAKENAPRILVIDEIQSKRHQEGRESGYRDNNALESLSKQREKLSEEKLNIVLEVLHKQGYNHWSEDNPAFKFDVDVIDKAEDGKLGSKEQMDTIKDINIRLLHIKNEISRQRKGIPSAPFEKNWHELAFKRTLRYAAENGFDKVAWTTGAQQAERYNLGKVVDSISIAKSKREEGKYHVTSWDKDTMPIGVASGNKSAEELKELFGKAVADELVNGVENLEEGSDTFVLEGAALEVGGEGMKGFYDKMLPSFVNKYVKKWGTKVQDIELPNLEEAGRIMHSVDVTEAMKESVMEGQTMFRVKDVQPAIDSFTSKYNSKPVVVVESSMTDKKLKSLVGFDADEVRDAISKGLFGGYNPNTEKIYIFNDNIKDISALEDTLFHENLHQYLLSDKSLVVEFFADAEDAYKKNIKQIKEQGYKAYEVPEELFVRVVADSQVKGNFAKVFSFLSEEGKEKLTNLLKENGYDIARETEIRTSGRMDGSGRDGSGRRNGDDIRRVAKESSSVASPSKVEKDGRAREIRQLFDQVADNGLRGVVGDKAYDSAMFEMYRSLPMEARERVAMDALNNHGADMGKAMDKFIGESYNTSLWDVVVGAIRNMLRRKGYDIRFSENDIRYLVWRNRQKLNRESILDVAEDIDTRYRLKVGEYEGSPTDGGDTPDGGETRFKVKDGEKTVQNLRDHVASLKEEVANLKKEVRDLRKGSKEEWETKQRAIISFVKGRLTKEAGEELGKTRIEQILTLVTKASNSNDLHKPLQFIEQVINSAIIDSAAARMDKLIKTRLQGETNRGVAKGVVVDEATRRLFDSIRGTFKDLIATSIDSELRHVRGEILRFGKEIKALPEDDTMNRNTLQKQQDALKERRKQLEEEQEELRKKNITETKEWITKRHDELVEAMDAHIEGNGVWTQEMQDEYDSLPLREKLAEIRESQNQMDAILADALRTRREAYMNTGEARKRLLAEADMIESNYSIAQEELIKLMNEVSNELSEIIKGGKERLASRKQMLAERRRMIVGMGIDAVKKRKVHSPNDTLSKEEKFHKWFDNSWLKKVSDFMTAPLNSFNFMLKYVDNNHTIGEGELYKHFMKSKEGALEANNRLYDGLKAYNTTIEEKVKEIFGKDIESVMKDSGKKHEGAVHKQYMYDSANHREGEMYPISISKGEALYVWLTWRQPDGYSKLIYDGWNEQSIAEIEELIGEQYMEFGEWVTDEFFPQLREDKYNKTHIEMFGTSMAKREHYFPFKVYDKDIQEKGEMGESYSGMPSTITGNIIKRTINKSRIDTEKNAFDLIFKYGNDMETWNAMAKLRQDLNFLHSSKAFRNYLEANSKGLYDKFIKSAEVAVKAYNNSGESNAINDFLVKFNRMWAGSNIGFRLNTAMKQILSYPAFTAYSGNPKYQANLAKYMLNWKGNYEWAKEFLPAFRNRIETGDMGMTGMSDPQFDLGKYIRKFSDAGMIPNQLVDALTCAAGARSVYDFEYDRAIKAGLTEEEAENIARYNAEIAFNETQQSSRDEFVSPIQISRNVLIKSMMNYQNSNVGYQRMGNEGLLEIMRAKQVYKEDIKNGMSESEAKKKMANSIARGVRKVVVAFAVLPGLWYLGGRGIVGITAPLISSLFGGGADDEPYLDDEAKEELLLSIALGTVAGTSGGQLIAGLAQGREYNPMAWMNEMQKDIVGAVKNGWNMNTTKNIALRLTKFGGVNIETFENIYLGVEHAIRTGNPDLVDFMMLINLPASQRKAMAEELYSDMPFMEYAEKVSRAQKLFDDYRKHLPYAKSDKTGSKKNAIKKQYIIENMDDSKQEELEKEKEFKKLKRDYNSAEDKKEWLEEHPEYKELEKEYADQTITKEVNKKVKELK